MTAMPAAAVPVAADLFPSGPAGDVILSDVIAELGYARMMVPLMAPHQWEHVAAFLFGLLDRPPLAGERQGWRCERLILSALAHDLRSYARNAGEPVGLELDLRHASSIAAEGELRKYIYHVNAQFAQRLEGVLAHDAALHVVPDSQEAPDMLAPDTAPAGDADEPTADQL